MIHLKERVSEFEKCIGHLTAELKNLRTGRAHAALVEAIPIEAYGAISPLQHVASISIPDHKTILVMPWDKSIIKDIEKGITHAQLGVNPINDGSAIRLVMPLLTEENRKQILKVMGQKVEQTRVSIRGIRDKIREEIMRQEKAKEITQDDRYRLQKELDELTRDHTAAVEKLAEEKEKEIMTV